MRKPTIAMLVTLATLLVCNQLPGFQTGVDSLEKHQSAVIAFELDVERMMQNEAMKSNASLQLFRMADPWRGIAMTDLESISGAVSLPESMDAFTEYDPGGSFPMEIVIRIKFKEADVAERFLHDMDASPFSATVEEDGNTYLRPTDEFKNFRLHQSDLKTIEMATKPYLMKEIEDLSTEGLTTAWDNIADGALRIAVDLEGRRDFFDEAVAVAKAEMPMGAGFFALIDRAQTLHVTADLDSDNLVDVVAITGTEKHAEEVRSGLEMLFEMVKAMGKQSLQQSHNPDSLDVQMANHFLNELDAEQSGNQVTVGIARPERFDEFIAKAFRYVEVAEARTEDLNRFRQYALAIHNYMSAMSEFPISAEDTISWRVRVLPYLDELELYRGFADDEAWDSDTNKPLVERMPEIFGIEGSTTDVCWIIPDELPEGFRDITDGSSNTIMLIQIPEGVTWTKPKDITIDEAIELFDELEEGESIIAAFYDGSVMNIEQSVDRTVLRNLMDPTDGNVIDR